MKNNFAFLVFCMFHALLIAVPSKSALTFKLNGGRFGDNISNYCKAKYLAHKNNIRFLSVPFKYSDKLMLHKLENFYKPSQMNGSFKQIVRLGKNESQHDLEIDPDASILYIVDFYYRPKDWQGIPNSFVRILQEYITPRVPLQLLEIPTDIISVALHVRRGGGFDQPLLSRPFADQSWPLKFPPDSYYIEQLKKVYELCGHQPLYVYLFTDDKNPQNIASKYRQELNKENIKFEYRTEGNAHNKNVLEDFFSMMNFDILIRSSSQLSRNAELLGNHSLTIFPTHHVWIQDTLIIDQVGTNKKPSFENLVSG